jgi:hypothetical protein
MQSPLEVLQSPSFKGPAIVDTRSTPDQWAGRTVLGSNAATVVVSTRSVNSDSIIGITKQFNAALPASGIAAGVCVRSINPGVSFIMGYDDGVARTDYALTLMWEIKRGS